MLCDSGAGEDGEQVNGLQGGAVKGVKRKRDAVKTRSREVPVWARKCPARLKELEQNVVPEYKAVNERMVTKNGADQNNDLTIDGKRFQPTLSNIIPSEDMTRTVMDFLWTTVVGSNADSSHVEIEAKIGQIVDTNSDLRLSLPVQNECALNGDPSLRIRFESNMSMHQHQGYNELLNNWLRQAQRQPDRVPITFVHRREVDSFYEEQQIPGFRGKPPRIRQTKNEDTDATLACVIKERIADLNIYCPKTAFDFRISVSVEQPFERSLLKAQLVDQRAKDRMSYAHQFFNVDLTQVSERGRVSRHELEVELDPVQLRREAALVSQGKPNHYETLVKSFLDNVRTLIRR